MAKVPTISHNLLVLFYSFSDYSLGMKQKQPTFSYQKSYQFAWYNYFTTNLPLAVVVLECQPTK